MIRLEKIVFGYGSMHKLFDGLSLTLLPGHIHGLLGVNGTGKTTLLKLASGLLFPSQGTVRVGDSTPRTGKRHFTVSCFSSRKSSPCRRSPCEVTGR